jgi:hypothetical protein
MKNYKSFKRDAKDNDGQTARREIVRTTLELDRLLGNN